MSVQTPAVSLRISALCLAIAILSGAAFAQRPPDLPAVDVRVVNAPSVTVANTPSVTVANTPAVTVSNTPTVTVGNTPAVTVANTPNVNISNTNTQPVVTTAIDNPGRSAYQSQVDNSNGGCSGQTCFFNFPAVPVGHRVVIQHVSGLIDFGTAPSAVWIQLNNGSGLPLSTFFAPLAPSTNLSAFDQGVLAFFDPAQFGGAIAVQVNLVNGTFGATGQAQIVTLSGYELDCTAAPCAPIAH